MFIRLNQDETDQQEKLCLAYSSKQLANRLAEECCELGQACHKIIRVLEGDTPVTLEEAMRMINEELGDVILYADYLEKKGIVDTKSAVESARKKNHRWYGRVIGNEW